MASRLPDQATLHVRFIATPNSLLDTDPLINLLYPSDIINIIW